MGACGPSEDVGGCSGAGDGCPEQLKRPTWRDSENDVEALFRKHGFDVDRQTSYFGGTKDIVCAGCVRPDLRISKNGGQEIFVEVKNYLFKNRNRMISTLQKQLSARERHLPKGAMQIVVIDMRGQVYDSDKLKEALNRLDCPNLIRTYVLNTKGELEVYGRR